MDRIFNEIKKAIEEEMARQEADRRGGAPRPTPPGGRDRQQYEAWLREEQERLRGGSTATEEVIEPEIQEVQEWEERPRRDRPRRQRSQDGRERRPQPRPRERPEPSTRHDRSEARHRRRSDSAYERRRRASGARGEITSILHSRNGVRKAILLSEIIGRPVSLRRQDEHLIS